MNEGIKGFEMINSDVIELPQDQGVIEKLTRKLAEYEARKLEWEGEDNERQVKKIKGEETEGESENPRIRAHEIYKYAILRRLIDEGRVEKDQISHDLMGVHNDFYPKEFEDAFRVVSSYASGNLRNVHGGTGLK